MLFGTIKKLLSSEYREFDDTILVESPFRETTRDGTITLRSVQLGLSSRAFIIASEHEDTGKTSTADGSLSSVIEILSLYPWDSIRLSVFKRSYKQVLKASFINNGIRYFELKEMPKRKIFWTIWRSSIEELNSSNKKWPFLSSRIISKKNIVQTAVAECIELRFIKRTEKVQENKWKKWTDKYLYLGSIREAEDKVRPAPVLGMGLSKEINLYYLKPRYFGCWEQTEHWVQCGESSLNTLPITKNE